jgi:hypothetical protein
LSSSSPGVPVANIPDARIFFIRSAAFLFSTPRFTVAALAAA